MQEDDGPDELCKACSQLDLYSLFTGGRYYSGDDCPNDSKEYTINFPLLTLANVNANTQCPLCRLIHHDLYTDFFPAGNKAPGPSHLWLTESDYVDPSKVQVYFRPFRADYFEEMRCMSNDTRHKLATILQVCLKPLEGLSEREQTLVFQHHRGCGIQLLSPDSIVPERPLQNGYQYTDTDKSLELLREWLDTCVEKHASESGVGTCRRPELQTTRAEHGIRVIDVQHRTIIKKSPGEIDYAALSYVWSQAHGEIGALDELQGSSDVLPPKVPKVVEDAMFVCQKLGIPYLWVDRHCIDQSDEEGKSREIESMAFRYLHAKITLIAGGLQWERPSSDAVASVLEMKEEETGLLPKVQNMKSLQHIETINGHTYITALPPISRQIVYSQWHQRAWTMQEGQLANRCAFFSNLDITFLCGSGSWRQSLHSGPKYGHNADVEELNAGGFQGHYMLGWPRWTKDRTWRFGDYSDLLMSYTTRQATFEADRLNAVTGCLNFIGAAKGVEFHQGMPMMDFHYALIWMGEYDRPRDGFPSWSWAGWHCLQIHHFIHPLECSTCTLLPSAAGSLLTTGPTNPEIEMEGLCISLTERAHSKNKCSQRFANITFPSYKTSPVMEITAEVAHFTFDIVAGEPKSADASLFPPKYLDVPYDYESTATFLEGDDTNWEMDAEYQTPYARIRLGDRNGNVSQYYYPRWYDHWPPLEFCLPKTLKGESLAWLLEKGISLIMVVELKLLEGGSELKPFHLVLCLGIDNRGKMAKRFGMFCLPKDVWEHASPKEETLRME